MSADSTHPLTTRRNVIGHLTVAETPKTAAPRFLWIGSKRSGVPEGLLKRVQLTISGCLGPCDLPNVVTISNKTGAQWFGEITEFEQYRDLVD
jgi:cobaltochelatase CobN